jgi:hypothetical protein
MKFTSLAEAARYNEGQILAAIAELREELEELKNATRDRLQPSEAAGIRSSNNG